MISVDNATVQSMSSDELLTASLSEGQTSDPLLFEWLHNRHKHYVIVVVC